MPSFGYGHIQLRERDLFIFLHTAQAPPPDRFADAIAAFEAADARNQRDLSHLCFLAVTDGGTPDPQRRRDFDRFLNGRTLRTAVVTDQALVRGAVSAISAFNQHIKVFSSQHIVTALQHVGFGVDDLLVVIDQLSRLQAGMDPVHTLAALLRLQVVRERQGDPSPRADSGAFRSRSARSSS